MSGSETELLRLRSTPIPLTQLKELMALGVPGGPDPELEYRSAWGVFVERPGTEQAAVAVAVRPSSADGDTVEVHPLGVAGSRRLAFVVAAVLGITADGVEAEVVLRADQEMMRAMASNLTTGIEQLLEGDP